MSQITAIYPCFLVGLKSKKPPAGLQEVFLTF